MVDVMNLVDMHIVRYTCSPKEAVVCAYAQYTNKDYGTWDYDEKYNHLVEEGLYTYLCGDWSVFKDGRTLS